MKKFLFILSAGFVLLLTSCSGKKEEGGGGMSAKAKANIAASDIVGNAFLTGDVSKIDSLVAKDFIDHTDQGDKIGPDSLKASITAMHKAGGDMKMEIIKQLADDDYVFSWQRYTGTSDGSMGMPKGPYNMTAIEVVRCKDGKAVEHWGFMEPRELMKMMGGGMPQPSAADGKASKDSGSVEKPVKTTD